VLPDHRVVHLDRRVDHAVGVAPALLVALAHLGIEQRRVLGGVDLDVAAAQADQLLDLASGEIDHVGQIGVARGIGGLRLVGIVVGGGLLGADQRYLAGLLGASAQVDPLLGAQCCAAIAAS